MTDPTTNEESADALAHVMIELTRAIHLHPDWPTDPFHALAILGDEFGELTKEIVQLRFEPSKASTIDTVRAEAIQTAAMAVRMIIGISRYQFTP